jgi:hypothetical protein
MGSSVGRALAVKPYVNLFTERSNEEVGGSSPPLSPNKINTMQTYILGYDSYNSEELTLYKNINEAEYNSEEWCAVKAESEEEARAKYETAFNEWKCGLVNTLVKSTYSNSQLNKPLEGYYAKDVDGVLWPFTWTEHDNLIILDVEVNPADYVIVHIKQLTADNYEPEL